MIVNVGLSLRGTAKSIGVKENIVTGPKYLFLFLPVRFMPFQYIKEGIQSNVIYCVAQE